MTRYGALLEEPKHKTTTEGGIIIPIDNPEDEIVPVEGESVEDLISKEIKETKLIVGENYDNALLTEGTCIIASKPKVGKSYFAMTMAIAIAGGHDFLGYKTRQCDVLYFDYETNDFTRQRRLKNILDANGWEVPNNITISQTKGRIGHGFDDSLGSYLVDHPNTGVVIIDMYQQIVDEKKSTRENDYEQAYRNFDKLNDLAKSFGIALILVMHSRKEVNQDDPFSNILGSVGLQGATDQMLTLGRRGMDGPIRMWGKAKTHDSSPMLTLRHENSLWRVVDNAEWDGYQEQSEDEADYIGSSIRRAIIEIVKAEGIWKGRARELTKAAMEIGVGIEEDSRAVGRFLHRYQGMLLNREKILVKIINNGSGGSIYEIKNPDSVKDIPKGFEQISNNLIPF